MVPKWCQNGSKMAETWPKNGAKMVQKRLKHGSKMASKRCQFGLICQGNGAKVEESQRWRKDPK